MYTHIGKFLIMKSATGINTYKFTYKNYLLKYAINYITITYMPKMLKSSLFSKYKKNLSLYSIKLIKLTRKENNISTKREAF